MEPSNSSSKNALLFIPDISGFTQFISDRDFQHRQYIIAELLEVLIETNPLNLMVNEIEGDAVFFYSVDPVPSMNDLLAQSEKMYMAFHSHLKKYGVSRLCNCPTCQSVSRLTLKFIAHYGQVSFHKIKEKEKLFGADVILVHRLLKNNVPEREYILISDRLTPKALSTRDEINLDWQKGSERYDLGEVNYIYSPLVKWYERVPEPEIPEQVLHRSKNPLVQSIEIDGPMEAIYDILIDLGQRKNYMIGLQAIEIKQQELHRLNRICTTFKCSMEHEQCTFETSGVEHSDNRVSFSETFKEHPITFDYILERNIRSTTVTIQVHHGFSIPMVWIFNLVMKRKISTEASQTLARLKTYCEKNLHI